MATDLSIQGQASEKSQDKATTTKLLPSWLSIPHPENFLPGLLTIYLGTSLVLWGLLLMDVATQQFLTLARFNGGVPPKPSEALTQILLALCGGGIGGIIYSIDKLNKYSKKKNGFDTKHASDYFIRQFVAATLGAILFILVSAGFITLEIGNPANSTPGYFAFALGFVAGFGSYQLTRKLDDIIKVAFGRLTAEDLVDDKENSTRETVEGSPRRKQKTSTTPR